MSYDLENKITMDELAPSLQKRLVDLRTDLSNTELELATHETNNSIHVTQDLKDKITNSSTELAEHEANSSIHVAPTDRTNWNNKLDSSALATTITTVMDLNDRTKENTIRDYIDSYDFLNFNPKIGFLDQTKANLSAAFNMSYSPINNRRPYHIISDFEGRLNLYFPASNDPSTPTKLYKAYRMSDSGAWVFENDPIKPPYFGTNDYAIDVRAAGYNYIIIQANVGGANVYHLILHNGTGNVSKWTTYRNITSLVNSVNIDNLIYFSEYDTLAAVYWDSSKILWLAVYNATTFSLIKKVQLFSKANIIYSSWWVDHPLDLVVCSYTYVNTKSQLIIETGCWWNVALNSDGLHRATPSILAHIFNIPPIFFKDGSGTISSAIDLNTEYKFDGSGDGIVQYHHRFSALTYDYYDDCIYVGWRFIDDVSNCFGRIDVKTAPMSKLYILPTQQILNPPDTCPWAKVQREPFLMGNNWYFRCFSNKYGEQVCHVNYKKNGTSNKLEVIGGLWSIYDNTLDKYAIDCVRYSDSNVKWNYINTGDNTITEVNFSGKDISLSNTPILTIPSLPSGIQNIRCWYNPINNKIYAMVIDITSTDATKQGLAYILEYDCATGVYKSHKNVSVGWMEFFNNSIGQLKTYAQMGIYSNIFINSDESMYFYIYYSGTVSNGKRLVKLSPQPDGTLLFTDFSINITLLYSQSYIGYDSNFGVFTTNKFNLWTTSAISCTRDYVNGGADKSIDTTFNGNGYLFYFGLNGSTGLVAYLQDTPIFLGGYYSTIPSQEIYLNPNSDNYIYFSRDKSDRTKVNINNFPKLMGDPTSIQFSRVLAGKITTDAANPTSQTLYNIG